MPDEPVLDPYIDGDPEPVVLPVAGEGADAGDVPPNDPPDLPEVAAPMGVAASEAPISSEALEELGEMQRTHAISRTDTQAISGFMIVGLFAFLAAYFDLDLDPVKDGYQSDFPKHIGEALTAIGAIVAVRVMNRRTK